MSFLKLILRNPFRVKSRAVLSIIGIAIGITLIVALGSISAGLKESTEQSLEVAGTDFVVYPTTMISSDGRPKTIDASYGDKIANFEGVKEIAPISVYYMFNNGNYFDMDILMGMDAVEFKFFDATMIDGKMFENNTKEVIIGKLYSKSKNLSVGDDTTVAGNTFKVAGIYEVGDKELDNEILTSKATLNNISNSTDYFTIYVKLDEGADVEAVKEKFDEEFKDDNLTAVSSLSDNQMMNEQITMIDGATWAISLLAIIVGGIGIINTMIMSIYDRIREFGVLKAVGWSKRRILIMVMGESIVLTLVSAVVGSIIAIIGTQAAVFAMGPDSSFTVAYTLELFVQAFAVALIVGIIGGVYPAYKASNMSPTEALRYE